MFKIITFTFVSLIVGTLGEPIFRFRRDFRDTMDPNKQVINNYMPWYDPPLPRFPGFMGFMGYPEFPRFSRFPGFPGFSGYPGFPGFPFFMPNANQIIADTQARIESIKNQIDEQVKQNDCEPTEIKTEDFTINGRNYTYITKICNINGPNGSGSSLSSSVTLDSRPLPPSDSGPVSSSSSSMTLDSNPLPPADSGSSSSSSSSITLDSLPLSNFGPSSSSETSSEPVAIPPTGLESIVGSGAYPNAGDEMVMPSVSVK